MKANILLTAPTSQHKDYCMKSWIKWITTDFSKYNYDILIVDNSKDPEYHKQIQNELGERGTVLHLPYDKDRDIRYTIAESNEMIRAYFIENSYEYMFFNESDVFAPKYSMDYMVQLNKYVVGLPYFVFQHYMSRLLAYDSVRAGYVRDSYIKTMKSAFIDCNGQIVNATNIGLGALMIHRGVLDAIDFTIDTVEADSKPHSDTYFHSKIMQKGIPVHQVQKHFALHLNGNWNKVYKIIEDERN